MKINVSTTAALNGDGETGAFLFVASPLAGSVCYAIALLAQGNLAWLAALGVIIASVGWSVGVVKLLKGRIYRHTVTIDRGAAPAVSQDRSSEPALWS